MSPPPPPRFGRYALDRKIGEGGMAEVYLASVTVAEGLQKRVVVKKIRREFADQPEFCRMFVDEAKIALGLNHANIVQVFDFGQVRGELYLAMELVEGVDLMRLVQVVHARGERIPAVIAAYIAHQVAAGLAYAHHKRDDFGAPIGIVHRDISPHNVMLAYAGTVKILDFGIARPVSRADGPVLRVSPRDPDVADAMTIQGKVAYMAPEQALGRRVDPRADIYSLGVVLYEMLAGRLVYRGKAVTELLEEVRTVPLPPLLSVAPDAPPELAALVDRALARDPDARWESARALQSALASFLHHADPVVDDEVLSHYVTRHFPARALALEERPSADDEATRELGESAVDRLAPALAREARPVVLLRAALVAQPLVPGEPSPDVSRFLHLARDVAYKRDALVCAADDAGLLFAFGALTVPDGIAEQAVHVALALREAIGEAAPGVGIGVALAEVVLTLQHRIGAPVDLAIDPLLDRHLAAVAGAAIDGPVMIVGGLADPLRGAWNLGEPHLIERELPLVAPWTERLSEAAPLLGPTHADPRIHHAPGARAVLYGRELELKALRDAFAEAIRARAARAAAVVGAAGLGKRAVIERFVAGIPRGAALVLRVVGQWRRRNVSLWAALELLCAALGLPPDTTRERLTARLAELRVADAPELADALALALALPSATADDAPRPRHEALGRLLHRLLAAVAQRRPVLIVVEALHFLDQHSVDLLSEWLRRAAPLPVLLVFSARPGPRAARLRELPSLVEIELGELDPHARRELIVRRFDDPEEAEPLAQAILARTAGNPLFIEETLAMLLRQGVIAWDPQGRYLVVRQRGAAIDLPPSVEAALLARLDALAPDDRAVVDAAAVLGQSFRPGELARLVERDVARAVDRLVALGVFEPDPSSAQGAHRFTTVSLHEVCKNALAGAHAEHLHGRAVDIKRARADYRPGRDDGPIAEHLLLAARPAEAVEPALRAARAARELAGNVEAHHFLSLALRALPPGDPRRFDALAERETILRAWGQRRAQGADLRELIEIAAHGGDPRQEVEAHLRLLRFYLECGRAHHAEHLAPRLAARIAALDDPSPALAALGELRSDLLLARGDLAAAERSSLDALAACADDLAGRRQRARLHQRAGQAQLGMGRTHEAAVSFGEALRLARELGDRRLQAEHLNALGEVAGRTTRYQLAIDHFREALEIDRELGDRVATGRKLANLGITYTAIGLYRRAERFLRKALELHEALGDTALLSDVVVHLGEVMIELGDTGAARSLLGDAAAMAAARGDLRTELRAHVRLARVLLDEAARSGTSPDPAAELAERALERARASGLRTAACRALHLLARIAAARDDRAQAIAYEREAVELVHAGAAPVDGVLSIHHLGRLLIDHGQADEGRRWLDEAAAKTRARLDDLRDPELRRGYLAQDAVRSLLGDRCPLE